jgi:hypothetical protein
VTGGTVRGSFAAVLRAAVRQPAVHFLVLGALLAGTNAWWIGTTGTERTRAPIVMSAARVAEIRADYARDVGQPSAAELDALIARAAEEEMLYREALVLGLDRGDRAVKWRIVDKMHFLFGDDAGDVETAYRRGLALGLARDDVVVRNALVTKMRLMAKAASRSDEPAGAELDRTLEEYLHAHADEYRQPARLTMTHVFLAAGVRGDRLDADARTLGERLAREHLDPAAAVRLGDPFASGASFRAASPRTLANVFGEPFAAAVVGLPTERWSGPIRSPYGVHFVWLAAADATSLPPLASVRERVLRAYRAERRAHYLVRMIDELRAAYPVEVERAG